ncbi:MAG TPA: hypothetical protein VJJ81_02795, partial [Candidatus Babeliales bacterium]|nr:hypothetical protein [Candidatus Babeliales bacterium]
LNQKNIGLFLLLSTCATNSFGMQETSKANHTEEYVNADGIRELREPVAAFNPGKAFGAVLDTFIPDDSSLAVAMVKRINEREFAKLDNKQDEFYRCLQSTPRFAYGFRTAHKNECVKTYNSEFTNPIIDRTAGSMFAIINHKPLVQALLRTAQANDPSTKISLSPKTIVAAIKRVASSGKISDWQEAEAPSPELIRMLNLETELIVEKMKKEQLSWARCVAKLAPVKPTIGLGNVADQQCHQDDPLDILERDYPPAIFGAIERELAWKKIAAESKTGTIRDAR